MANKHKLKTEKRKTSPASLSIFGECNRRQVAPIILQGQERCVRICDFLLGKQDSVFFLSSQPWFAKETQRSASTNGGSPAATGVHWIFLNANRGKFLSINFTNLTTFPLVCGPFIEIFVPAPRSPSHTRGDPAPKSTALEAYSYSEDTQRLRSSPSRCYHSTFFAFINFFETVNAHLDPFNSWLFVLFWPPKHAPQTFCLNLIRTRGRGCVISPKYSVGFLSSKHSANCHQRAEAKWENEFPRRTSANPACFLLFFFWATNFFLVGQPHCLTQASF